MKLGGGKADKNFFLFYSQLYPHHLERIIGAQSVVAEWMIDGTLKCVSSTHAHISNSQGQSPDPTNLLLDQVNGITVHLAV